MKSYIFPVRMEYSDAAWHICVPELESRGAATWGRTPNEALRNIQEVMQMVIEDLVDEGAELPHFIQVAETPTVAVTV